MTAKTALNIAIAQGDSGRFFYATENETLEDEKKKGRYSGPKSNTEIKALHLVPIPHYHRAVLESMLLLDEIMGSNYFSSILVQAFQSGYCSSPIRVPVVIMTLDRAVGKTCYQDIFYHFARCGRDFFRIPK